MTQEEKQLLLRDLCMRLPYGVKLKFYLPLTTHFAIETLRDVEFRDEDIFICSTTWNAIKLEFCKPYLRPISSMTEEEQKEFVEFHCVTLCPIIMYTCLTIENECNMLDWLNAHHFDYRELIEKGLALEAPEGIYNTKN